MVDIYYSRVGANTYVIFNENNEAFVVDPGFSNNNQVIDHIKKLKKDIKAILITHGHYDHIYALEDLVKLYPNAKVYISSNEKDFLTNPDLNLSTNSEFGEIKLINFLPNNLVEVDDEDIINVCGYKIKVIATPFHTKGSLCYFITDEKLLFSGDTLFYSTIGRSDLPTGTSRTIESSLLKLKKLPEDIKLYPGHGPISTLDREKAHNAYLKNI